MYSKIPIMENDWFHLAGHHVAGTKDQNPVKQ